MLEKNASSPAAMCVPGLIRERATSGGPDSVVFGRRLSALEPDITALRQALDEFPSFRNGLSSSNSEIGSARAGAPYRCVEIQGNRCPHPIARRRSMISSHER